MYGVNSGYSGVGAYQTTPRYGQQYESYGAYQPGVYQPQQAMPMQQAQGASGGVIKGRPVSSEEEARASMIDLDGSLFVFTDVARHRIYTKQIMLDGSADFKTYVLSEQMPTQNQAPEQEKRDYVLRDDFNNTVKQINTKINKITKMVEGMSYESNADEHDRKGAGK